MEKDFKKSGSGDYNKKSGDDFKKKSGGGNQAVYGIHAVEELISKNIDSIDKIYFSDKKKESNLFEVMRKAKKLKVNYANIPDEKLDKMCDNANHQGVVAFRTVRKYDPDSALWKIAEEDEAPLFIIPSAIEDPGNLGAIIRSAAAFGASAIILERKGSVQLNGTVAKTSAGMIENMTICKPARLEALVGELKLGGFTIIGVDGAGDSSLYKTVLSGPTVLITGGEHNGIPAYLKKQCDKMVSIPMQQGVDSLNVSVAAGIIMYEALKQRQM
jgi:23S rRNA (guanosine2251-2'-O)-methyltransferase